MNNSIVEKAVKSALKKRRCFGYLFYGDDQKGIECKPVQQFSGITTLLELFAVFAKRNAPVGFCLAVVLFEYFFINLRNLIKFALDAKIIHTIKEVLYDVIACLLTAGSYLPPLYYNNLLYSIAYRPTKINRF